MGWIPGWIEGVCSADAGGAGVCAESEYSGWVALSPGLRPELHAD